MTRTRARSCSGKVRYATKAEARSAAISATKRFFTRYVAYKCRFCGGRHIGHPSRPRR